MSHWGGQNLRTPKGCTSCSRPHFMWMSFTPIYPDKNLVIWKWMISLPRKDGSSPTGIMKWNAPIPVRRISPSPTVSQANGWDKCINAGAFWYLCGKLATMQAYPKNTIHVTYRVLSVPRGLTLCSSGTLYCIPSVWLDHNHSIESFRIGLCSLKSGSPVMYSVLFSVPFTYKFLAGDALSKLMYTIACCS